MNINMVIEMLEQVHKHIMEELKTNTKTDTIFILAAIILNLITLGVNSVISMEDSAAGYISFTLFLILAGVVNWVVIKGLKTGKESRNKLLSGLIKMYSDQNVAEYYDSSLLNAYGKRYIMFITVVVATGVLAFVIPLVLLVFE